MTPLTLFLFYFVSIHVAHMASARWGFVSWQVSTGLYRSTLSAALMAFLFGWVIFLIFPMGMPTGGVSHGSAPLEMLALIGITKFRYRDLDRRELWLHMTILFGSYVVFRLIFGLLILDTLGLIGTT